MSLRSEVTTLLLDQLGDGWDGYDHGRTLTGPTRPTFMVEQTKLEPGASAGLRNVTLSISVTVPGEDPAKVEDSLEDALDELLSALDAVPHVFVSAERGVINDSSLNAYAVTVTVPARKE